MSNYQQNKWNWKKFQKGRGIKVALTEDFNKNGQQKYRPGIIIKSYPSHVKVQLMSTQPSEHDYFSMIIDNQTQYIRPIYFRTININDIVAIWKDSNNKSVELDKKSVFFTKIIEMEYQESFNYSIDLSLYNNKYFKNEMKPLKKIDQGYELE